MAGGECAVDADNLPYGIDDPLHSPKPLHETSELLGYLRRHGSYLGTGNNLGLLGGVSVVIRGLVLNLLIIWLPLLSCCHHRATW